MWFFLLSSIDIDLDIAMIVSSLAPSILIIVTYYFTKKKTNENHSNNTERLDTIQGAVNGRLTDAIQRIEKLESLHEGEKV